ncbi:MAG: beta-ketoacyl-ACP synthase [Bacteroidetes bacterium HGW-Bacteroidetes-21]|jgi:3-oxoacyl-(acyl-carrier-protein) synthase|nr:MAG: beta-ketoacyl-ACP synthase [Bacteroidetes bacterium HGW-Bacteroidetes-21]
MKKRVVVTGIGIVSPNGIGQETFTQALKQGISGLRHFPELEALEFGCQVGGIPDISQSTFKSWLELYNLITASQMIQYAVIAGLEAWTDAGFKIPETPDSPPDYDTGAIIGTGIGTIDIYGERIIPITNQKIIKKLRSTIVEHSMLSGGSATLSSILGLGNRLSANSSACNTGTESIIEAFERIQSGKALRMMAGASEPYSPWHWSPFDAMRVTTRSFNQEPSKASRPMSATASGFVPSSGAGMLILEELETARQRNAPIYAEILGGFINSGGQRNGGSMTAPSSEGVIRCIHGALENANAEPQEIDLISGHLSSTMADPLEISNWSLALNRKGKDFPYINATKSLVGHTIGAAGVIETIAALMEMKNSFIHPSLNCEDLHPDIARILSPERIPHQAINNININCFAKASFGFGDVNSCIIFKKL